MMFQKMCNCVKTMSNHPLEKETGTTVADKDTVFSYDKTSDYDMFTYIHVYIISR